MAKGGGGSGYFHEDEILGKAVDLHLLRRLWTFIRPHSKWLTFSTLTLVLVTGLSILPAILVKLAVDGPVREVRDGLMPASEFGNAMLPLLVGFGAALALSFGLRAVQMVAINTVGQRTMLDLRDAVFRHIQKQQLSFFDRNPVGRLVTRVVHDVESLNQVLTAGVDALFHDILLLTAIVSYLLWLNWELALITFTVLPFLFYAAHIFRTRNMASFRAVRGKVSAMNAYLQEAVTGMRVIQLFAQEKRAARGFGRRARDLASSHLETVMNYSVFFPTVEILSAIAKALLLWYGATAIPAAGEAVAAAGLTPGEFVEFFLLLDMFFHPIRDISEKYNLLQSAMASSERIFQVLDTEATVVQPENPKPLPEPARGEVELDHVTFSYNDGEPVLKDVSFQVRPGERVALVGATGAGKTTITSLLSRLYDVDSGTVRVDGVDVREADLPTLRRRIGVVLQDVFLFAGDIKGNIDLGNRSIGLERVKAAAKAVHAHDFIERLEHGYDTEVRERGATLSVGQKQLLSFARALAHDPAILVLDEATSSVDSQTEVIIQDALERLMAGRTALVVAHRLSTIKSCDRILVLHHGVLREVGTHEELLAQGGLYARLYQLQFAAQEGTSVTATTGIGRDGDASP